MYYLYQIIIVSSILLFITVKRSFDIIRLYKYGLSKKGEDSSCQYFYYIKALSQNSLCPEFEIAGKPASVFYPLGIYWLSINIAKRLTGKKRLTITYESLDNPKSLVNTSLKVLIFLNVLLFPLLALLNLALIYILLKNYSSLAFVSILL